MNILQEIGVQSWRLRGRKSQHAESLTVSEEQAQKGNILGQLSAPAGDIARNSISPSAALTDVVQARQNIIREAPLKSACLSSSSSLDTPTEKNKKASESGPTSTMSLTTALADAEPSEQEVSKAKKDNDALGVKMPTLRPAPVPLEALVEVDLTFDTAEPAAKQSSSPGMPQPPEPDITPDYSDVYIPPQDDDEYLNVGIDLPIEETLPVDPAITALSDLDWRTLQARISTAETCPSCGQNHSVLGFGDVLADWVFVSDAPTSAELQANQLFSGRAGQLYEAILRACGLTREAVYTTTVFKCSPPDDLSVSPQCNKLIHRQIELIQPKVIVAFGEFSAQSVLRANESFEVLAGAEQLYHSTQCKVITSHSLQQLLSEPELKSTLWNQLKTSLPLSH